MTQVFIFSEKEAVRVLEIAETPEVISSGINSGRWEKYVGYEPLPSRGWQALRLGRRVVVTDPMEEDSFPEVKILPRELAILQGLAAGYSAAEVAWNLHVGERTVHSHLKHLRNKLGVKSTLQLMAVVTALGIVHPELEGLIR